MLKRILISVYYLNQEVSSVAKRFTKNDILTIPNLLSFFRLLLIPVFVLLYIRDNHIAAVIVIAISGTTDIADGKIARSFNMVSDFGKIIDPIADKLTQAALIICLIAKYKWMIVLILFMAVKEGFMLLAGYLTLKFSDTVNSSKWYGKLSTVVLYAALMFLILFPNITYHFADALIALCGAVMLLSLIMYIRFYFTILAKIKIAVNQSVSFIKIWKIGLVVIWISVITAFVIHQDDISVSGILRFTPANPLSAAFIMLALYVLKSLSIVIFIGLLYIASGIAFSLPAAVTVNLLGIAVAVSIPYYIGKKIGKDAVNTIVTKHPKAEYVRKLRSGNDFFFSFIINVC